MTTADRFLDGRLTIRQPQHGFRAGLDAVMLAAAVPAAEGEALELGAGVGTASLCLAARTGLRVCGVEIDPDLVALAAANAAANGLDVRFVAADALALPAELRRDFDAVFCNPPFYAGDAASPEPGRARAKMDGGTLPRWLAAGLKRTRAQGTFTALIAADRLGEALSALPVRGVGIIPLWPRAGQPAKRIVLQVRKTSRRPTVLHPGLILHDGAGYTPQADAILRGRETLAFP